MKLKEPSERSGVFWLPTSPDRQSPGVLRISTLGETTVEITGCPVDPLLRYNDGSDGLIRRDGANGATFNRILGQVEGIGAVTLERCILVSGPLIPTGTLATATFAVDVAILGAAYAADECVEFTAITFEVERLSEWLNTRGMDWQHTPGDRKGTIVFEAPEPISGQVNDDLFAEVQTWPRGDPVNLNVPRASVELVPRITVWSRQMRSPFEQLRRLIRNICDFFSLGLNQPVSPTSVKGHLEFPSSDEFHERTVQVVCQYRKWLLTNNRYPTRRSLFDCATINGQFFRFLGNWLLWYEKAESAFELYFAAVSDTSQYLQMRTLWLVQAMESLHRSKSNRTELETSEFRRRRRWIVPKCPIEWQAWVRKKLTLTNELSLRQRLQELFEPHSELIANSESTIAQAVRVRNRLSHASEDADDPRRLFALHEKLQGVFQLLMMESMGIGEARISEIVDGNAALRRRLRTNLSEEQSE